MQLYFQRRICVLTVDCILRAGVLGVVFGGWGGRWLRVVALHFDCDIQVFHVFQTH